MNWLEKLQEKWKLDSLRQVVIVLIVFALTGTSVFLLKPYLLSIFGNEAKSSIWFSVGYYIFILPIYNVILLFYGFVFGQFKFFWSFEIRMWNRLIRRRTGE